MSQHHGESSQTAPIAIVGYSIRFPQDATSVDSFWQMLVDGRSARTRIPSERFNSHGFYHPDVKRYDSLRTREGHFLKEDLAAFDAPFFSCNPSEAATMDPQQRGLLETSYRALENAGLSLTDVAGSKTSVHIGSFTHDWRSISNNDPLMQSNYSSTGSEFSMMANRLSWFYDLTGPSVSLDTACSSSLSALHLGCQSLLSGEADMGLVGGANVVLDPKVFMDMENINMLSPDGKCYSFDHRANGYARGEGFGIVIIKLLSQAIQDGDTIRGIVRATGSNQDGRTPSITQPNGNAQEQLISSTYEKAGLDRSVTRYCEAHGTGTQVGDPIEAKAIAAAFTGQRPDNEPLYIGSVKTNIGHLEGTSGIASLIKTCLVLEKGLIPPNIWFEKTNPQILESGWNIKFPVETVRWPIDGLRRASINSFGFGGSNVHVVLDDVYHHLKNNKLRGVHCTSRFPYAPTDLSVATPMPAVSQECPDNIHREAQDLLFVWSAGDEDGLKRIAKLYANHLSSLNVMLQPEKYLENLAYTLSCKRSHLGWRSYIISSSDLELQQSLNKITIDGVRSTSARRIALVFTGQGAQWHAMGIELMRFAVFKASLIDAQVILTSLGCEWLLLDELSKDKQTSNVHDPAYSQPLCTALQVALVDLLWDVGLCPSGVIGHSSGEIAAAYCIGAICKRSALKIAFFRGVVAASCAHSARQQRAMMSVGMSEEKIQPYLNTINTGSDDGDVVVGCVNSPQNVTLSGPASQVNVLQSMFDREEVVAKKLKVNVAYHSRAMNEIALRYESLLGKLNSGEVPADQPNMFSSVTEAKITIEELVQAKYWVRNMTSQVKFSATLLNLLSHSSVCSGKRDTESRIELASATDLMEIGPHSTLRKPIIDTLSGTTYEKTTYDSILTRGMSAVTTFLSAMGRLHCLGHDINIAKINDHGERRSREILPDLPEYPFDHSKSYWAESRLSKNFRFRTQPQHELLGTQVPDWNPADARWRLIIQLSVIPWVSDHKVNGVELYPAAGLLVMAIEAARQVTQEQAVTGYKLSNVAFARALISLSTAQGFETQTHLRPLKTHDEKSNEFRICTYENGSWVENCRGTIAVEREEQDVEIDYGREAQVERQHFAQLYEDCKAMRCKKDLDQNDLYDRLDTMGLKYGPTFQVLQDVQYNHCEAIGRIQLRKWTTTVNENEYQDHIIHPTALDGVLQLSFAAITNGGEAKTPTMVPEGIRRLWISSSGLSKPGNEYIKAYAKTDHQDSCTALSTILALEDASDKPLIVIEGLKTKVVGRQQSSISSSSPDMDMLCHRFTWQPDLKVLSDKNLRALCKASTPNMLPPDSFIEDTEFMCYALLLDALEYSRDKGPTDKKPHLQKYIKWMECQSTRYARGELVHWRPKWPSLKNDRCHVDTVISRVESFSAEGRLYAEVAQSLIGILAGRVDALGLLFTGELVAEYYREANGTLRGFATAEPFLRSLALANPGLKVLEIGAGTGSSTAFVLQKLVHRADRLQSAAGIGTYVFTDISPSFFENARQNLKDYAQLIDFTTLNIEEDPLQQGFQSHSFDLIIAANVLHATSNLSETIQNTRKLLKPGGKLMLSELHNDAIIRAEFVFGLLPGWWRSTEDKRQGGPLIPVTDWHDVLCANGFSGTDLVFKDYEDPRNHMSNLMISTALTSTQSPPKIPEIVILVSTTSTYQIEIANHFRDQLARVAHVESEVRDYLATSPELLKQKFAIFLPESEHSFLHAMGEEDFIRVKCLFASSQGVLWVTRGGGQLPQKPETEMVYGLARCLRSEDSSSRLITLALHETTDSINAAHHVATIIANTFNDTSEHCETEYEERDGTLYINRLIGADDVSHYISRKTETQKPELQCIGNDQPLALSIGSPGFLDTMEFVDDLDFESPLGPDEVEIHVKAIGVNFKDVLIALGQLSEGGLGNECAGIVTRAGPEASVVPGDRVGVCCLGAYKTYVRCDHRTVFKIPDTVSFSEAASLPVAYGTAYQALYEIARVTSEDTILIHSGAGGTGQAAIQLAKVLGAEIFVTVGSEVKKQLIMDLYAIPNDHVLSSRGLSFAKGIKRMTNGRGVDVVLNSLAGESLQASWECLAPFGRFVEIGKRDILNDNALSMLPFNENRSFAAINMTHMLSERPSMVRKMMAKILDLLKDGKIGTPRPLHIYKISEIEESFRYLQGGKNTGKTVLEVCEDDLVPVVPSQRPSYSFSSDVAYLISGGLGGLGRCIARWMVDRGAKYLILLSRSGASSEDAKSFLSEIQAREVTVAIPHCDISDEKSLASTLSTCAQSFPPIRGCVQASMVLEDSIFENMSLDAFNAAIKPKVHGSWNLHRLLPRDLDFFILLSSASGIIGFPSQANYAAGNTYQDALARHRIMHELKAVSIDLGSVAKIGYVAEHAEAQATTAKVGLSAISEVELLALLEYYCDPALGLLSPETCQIMTGRVLPLVSSNGVTEEPYWMGRSQFRALKQRQTHSTITTTSDSEAIDTATLLSKTETVAEASEVITTSLINRLAKIMSMPVENIDPNLPLHVCGVDSLVAVELRNWFAKEVDQSVTVFEILGKESIEGLTRRVAGKYHQGREKGEREI